LVPWPPFLQVLTPINLPDMVPLGLAKHNMCHAVSALPYIAAVYRGVYVHGGPNCDREGTTLDAVVVSHKAAVRAGEDARDSLVAGVADLEALIAGFETP
jgi:hypothetical protein